MAHLRDADRHALRARIEQSRRNKRHTADTLSLRRETSPSPDVRISRTTAVCSLLQKTPYERRPKSTPSSPLKQTTALALFFLGRTWSVLPSCADGGEDRNTSLPGFDRPTDAVREHGTMGTKAKPSGVGGRRRLAVFGQFGNLGAKKAPTGAEQPFGTIVDGHAPGEAPQPLTLNHPASNPGCSLAVGVHSFEGTTAVVDLRQAKNEFNRPPSSGLRTCTIRDEHSIVPSSGDR